jgi:hypothetical protein
LRLIDNFGRKSSLDIIIVCCGKRKRNLDAENLEAAIRIELMNKAFAELCLTTWLRRRKKGMKDEMRRMNNFIPYPSSLIPKNLGAGDEI